MILGVTGTRDGMSDKQIEQLTEFLESLDVELTILHHGDCVGADFEAATIATMLGIQTISHPPIFTTYRAYHKSTHIRKPDWYLARNKLSQLLPSANDLVVNDGTFAGINVDKLKNGFGNTGFDPLSGDDTDDKPPVKNPGKKKIKISVNRKQPRTNLDPSTRCAVDRVVNAIPMLAILMSISNKKKI